MRFIWDHDLHIHSNLSTCANDPEQTPQNILAYAQRNGLTAICLTDHFWDERVCTVQDSDPSYHFPSFYKIENFSHISKVAPLPQAPGVRFLFGCETELDRNMTLGLSKERMDLFDFIVIPTTHLHFNGFTISDSSLDAKARAALWISRLDGVLHMDLPFHKIGIAHLTDFLIYRGGDHICVLNLIADNVLERLFSRAAAVGCGIEINLSARDFTPREQESVLRFYRIAKRCGCKFYIGSDAHEAVDLREKPDIIRRAILALDLQETDKFHVASLGKE